MNRVLKKFACLSTAVAALTVFSNLVSDRVCASDTPDLSTVTVAGSFQDELGCSADWQPDCSATYLFFDTEDTIWQQTFYLPAGYFQYKVTLNDSWDENYGAHAIPDGDNIALSLSDPTAVKFYYSHETHWITDNVNSVIATVVGSFQDELGCSDHWQPWCLRSWLQDLDGDGLYSFSTSKIPAGDYEFKVALNEDWSVSYPAYNLTLSVPWDNADIVFTYDSESHLIDVDIAPPPAPRYRCTNFEPPMTDFPVSFKRNHAIPLRAELYDENGFEVTGLHIDIPPYVEVTKISGIVGDSTIISDDLLPTGQGDDGNEFYYTESGLWQLIFDTKLDYYISPGTYEITMKSGDMSEYIIDPTCTTEFVVE